MVLCLNILVLCRIKRHSDFVLFSALIVSFSFRGFDRDTVLTKILETKSGWSSDERKTLSRAASLHYRDLD